MRAVDDETLLSIWEHGHGRPPYEQALVALSAALPEVSPNELAQWPLGQRDQHLVEMRKQLFGDKIETVTTCPKCDLPLELEFELDQLSFVAASAPQQPAECGEYLIHFRLPSSADLAFIAKEPPQLRRQSLLVRCIELVRRGEAQVPANELPGEVADVVEIALMTADPRAEINIGLECASCGHAWATRFDILSFLWTELNAWAQRLLADVHTLAMAYGWSEESILRLSPWRRQTYLNMVRQ